VAACRHIINGYFDCLLLWLLTAVVAILDGKQSVSPELLY